MENAPRLIECCQLNKFSYATIPVEKFLREGVDPPCRSGHFWSLFQGAIW